MDRERERRGERDLSKPGVDGRREEKRDTMRFERFADGGAVRRDRCLCKVVSLAVVVCC